MCFPIARGNGGIPHSRTFGPDRSLETPPLPRAYFGDKTGIVGFYLDTPVVEALTATCRLTLELTLSLYLKPISSN
jgi:hypothetical protein